MITGLSFGCSHALQRTRGRPVTIEPVWLHRNDQLPAKFRLILLGLDQLCCFILQASLPQRLWWWCGKCDTKLWLHLFLCELQWDNHSHAGRASAEMPWPFVLLYFACRSYSGPEKQQSGSCFRWYNLRLHVALDYAGPSTERGQQLKYKSLRVVNEPTAQHFLYFTSGRCCLFRVSCWSGDKSEIY